MEFVHNASQVMTMAEKAFSPAGCPGLLTPSTLSVHSCYCNRILEAGRRFERLLR